MPRRVSQESLVLFPVVLFASLALIQQAPTSGQTPPPAELEATTLAPVSVPRPVAETTQICRTEPVTGSRFGRRVCRSSVQTQEDRAASQEMLRRMQGARMPDGG
jgi:hypothetical protein